MLGAGALLRAEQALADRGRDAGARDGRELLEGLRVPRLHLADRRHLVEPVGQVLELLHAVREPDGKLLGEELRGAEEGACRGTPVSCDARPTMEPWRARRERRGRSAPVDGRSPNCTICFKLTLVGGKDE